MQNCQYLQLSVNYYGTEDETVSFEVIQQSDVWRGLQDYLETLGEQGWIIIAESKAEDWRNRTYQLRKPDK